MINTMDTNQLHKMAMQTLEAIEREVPEVDLTKKSFVPIPGGQLPPQPADPMAAGGGAPMDPSMGGMPPGMPPGMDPAMMGAAPMAPAPMDPAMMGGAPISAAAGPSALATVPPQGADPEAAADPIYDMMIQAVREVLPQVLQEMGVEPGKEGEGEGDEKPKKKKKPSAEDRLATIEAVLGVTPDMEGEGGEAGAAAAAGLTAGSGEPAPLDGTVPIMGGGPGGPLDPGLSGMMNQVGAGGGPLPTTAFAAKVASGQTTAVNDLISRLRRK